MAQEIERKFLVKGDFKSEAIGSFRIIQGYLCSNPERTVRIRIQGEKAFITVKGKSSEDGVSRFEWEKRIPLEDARELLQLCEEGLIEKTRYLVQIGENFFQVDEFSGLNEGLVVAEIELYHEDDYFIRPKWLGQEVTGDPRYYNSALKDNPFTKW